MKLYLIRHGITQGNLQKRYIGTTDEPLCAQGREALLDRAPLPKVQALYSSPRRRCLETARMLYPGMEATVIDEFRECDFGDFENKNYLELAGNPAYQQWVDSGGMLPFPNGESREAFVHRSVEAMRQLAGEWKRQKLDTAAAVVHGGTIMAVLSELGIPEGTYYDFGVPNGGGYVLEPRGERFAWRRL